MTAQISPDVIYVDVRALQDPDYRFRGVGQHSASLLTALRQYSWAGGRPRMIALADTAREPLYPEHLRFFDEVRTGKWRPTDANAWFLTLSPMTHDPLMAAEFLTDPKIFKITLFYDLIQLHFPNRYLHVAPWRTDFMNAFAWLGHYDVFASISQDTSNDLVKFRAVDPSKTFVSGVAVRRALEPVDGEAPLPRADRRHILVAGGGDPRKNPECALLAKARSMQPAVKDLPIYVFGNYPPPAKAEFRRIFGDEGGDNLQLIFPDHLDDEALRQLYRNAVLTIVPSRAEGFSIPIVESAAAGTPVTVSSVGAHPELVGDADLQFHPDDADALCAIIDRLVTDEAEWTRRFEEIRPLWAGYTTEEVGRRFMEGVLSRIPTRVRVAAQSPAILRGARPQLAVLTPLPPAQSGVADYSEATLVPMARHADLHIFTDSEAAEAKSIYRSMGSVAMASYSAKRFDQSLAVLGNSHFHTSIYHYLLDHGGAALAHDARMINFYAVLLGVDKAREVGAAELGKPVSEEELTHWLVNQQELPVLFLSEIAKAAAPMIVHSPVTAKQIEKLYGVSPRVLPFAQYRPMSLERVSPQERQRKREELGWAADEFVITSFGFVSPDKAPEVLIWSLRMLRNWNVKARLVFCGLVGHDIEGHLYNLVNDIGVADCVTFFPKRTTEQMYVDHLIATDAAIQLRTYFMGGLSGALNDCVAAAVPTVANDHLAEASLAPSFVRRIPDDLSPVLIAEAFLDIMNSGEHRARPIDAAAAFADQHSLDRYGALMMQALGFDVAIGQ